MARKKKITVKAIANSRLKAKEGTNPPQYPLYAQVSYNRLTTRLPIVDEIYVSEESVTSESFTGKEKIDEVRKLVAHEAYIRNPEFSVRGLGAVYLAYLSDFRPALETLIFNRLHDQLQEIMSYSQYHLYVKGEGEEARSPSVILGPRIHPYTSELLGLVNWLPYQVKVKEWVIGSDEKLNFIKINQQGITGDELELLIRQIDRAANKILDTGTYCLH